jgi:hypothetical protein
MLRYLEKGAAGEVIQPTQVWPLLTFAYRASLISPHILGRQRFDFLEQGFIAATGLSEKRSTLVCIALSGRVIQLFNLFRPSYRRTRLPFSVLEPTPLTPVATHASRDGRHLQHLGCSQKTAAPPLGGSEELESFVECDKIPVGEMR